MHLAKGAKVPMSSLRTLPNPYRGVRAHAPPRTIAERFAMLSLVRPGLLLSHCSAALVWDLPVPRSCEHPALHVTAPGTRLRRPGVVAHRGVREADRVAGVPVTSLADTWIDLAASLPLADLVVLGDAVVRRLGSIDPLRQRAGRRVPGVVRAREALEWMRLGSRSAMETRSRVLFARAGLPEPALNAEIHDPDGGWLATSDLVWRERRVVGEYQGAHHFGDYARGDDDILRRRLIEGIGWVFVDFTKDDYYARPRRVALLRRLAGHLGCGLDPARLAAIEQSRELPGAPVRPCGA